MSTVGLYFRMDQPAANALRARLNEMAAGFGYTAAWGPTAGQGNLAALLVAIDAGDVILVRINDTQNGGRST